MAEVQRCPRCGSPLAAGVLGGACPACLLRVDASDRDADDAGAGDASPHAAGPPATATASVAPRPLDVPGHPQRIGPYRVIGPIGEGGMGLVYKAEQQQPIRRTVAIKLIKPGLDSQQVLARFESERQSLALMSHPHVARVLDAGTTDLGRPYFVMEYVAGESITAFCDRHRYTTRQRLRLFVQACEAVQHAHQKAIIHRDLKPSNILVTLAEDGRPSVKVIDFGVAKATAQRLTERTLFTELGQLVGTPEYMSPEQAEMNALDVDTRSDVYSLGVVLYELLAGALPFDGPTLRRAAFAEIQRIIREVDPPRPSTRLSGLGDEAASKVASQRQTEPKLLARELQGELEWIPLKAMRKDRAERYATASALVEDVQNYLDHRPLVAGPESRLYRARKFVRRNRRSVTAAAALGTLLVGGSIGTTVGLIRATRAEAAVREEQHRTEAALAEAERRREEAEAINAFLNDDVLGGATPERIMDKSIRDAIVKAFVDPAAATVADRFKDKPLVEAGVRSALGSTYQKLGRADLGLPHATRALEIRRERIGPSHRDTLKTISNLAIILQGQGKLAEAEPLLREALQSAQTAYGADDTATVAAMSNLGHLLYAQGKLAESEALLRRVLEWQRRARGEDQPNTLTAINNLARVLHAQGKLAEAEPLTREAVERMRRVLGDDHPDTLYSINNMGRMLQGQGKHSEAEPVFVEALRRMRRVLGEDHPDTLILLNNLGSLYQIQGRHHEAEPLLREALDIRERKFGRAHPDTLISMSHMGRLLEAQGRALEAERLFVESLEGLRGALGPNHRYVLVALGNLGGLYAKQGRHPEAEPLLREAYQRSRETLGEDNPQTLRALNNVAQLQRIRGHLDEAESLFRQLLQRTRRTLGDEHPDARNALHNLAMLTGALIDQERYDRALPLAQELFAAAEQYNAPPGERAIRAAQYGRCLAASGRYEQAEALLTQARDLLLSEQRSRDPAMATTLAGLAQVYSATGRTERAAEVREELEALPAAAPRVGPASRPTSKPTTVPSTSSHPEDRSASGAGPSARGRSDGGHGACPHPRSRATRISAAVRPLRSVFLASAPAAIRMAMASRWPSAAACISAVCPW